MRSKVGTVLTLVTPSRPSRSATKRAVSGAPDTSSCSSANLSLWAPPATYVTFAPCRKMVSDSRYRTPGSSRAATRSPRTSGSATRRRLGLCGVRPAWRTQLARDTACSLADRCCDAARKSARKDTFGGVDHPDRAHCVTTVVENRSRCARLAQHRLVAFGGDALVANRLQLLTESRFLERPFGQLGQGLGQQVFDKIRG